MNHNKKKAIKTPATSTKGYWFGYKKDGKRSDPSPTVKLMDKHNQIVMLPDTNHVGVSIVKVSMRDGMMKGTYKGIKVQHRDGGVWVVA